MKLSGLTCLEVVAFILHHAAMTKTPKRPRDPNQLAKMVIDIAASADQGVAQDSGQYAMSELGRLGGLKGGRARAERLSAETRSEIAKKAARKRWSGDRGD